MEIVPIQVANGGSETGRAPIPKQLAALATPYATPYAQGLNLPLFDVPLSHLIMRPSIAVPLPSFSQTASD